MENPIHAFDFLAQSESNPPAPFCVAFGNERFLKRLVLEQLRVRTLGVQAEDLSVATFDGTDCEWRDVMDELSTASLFDSGKRLVQIQEADDFVSDCRSQLENYIERPRSTATLVLEVNTWPANTRLYKAVARSGLNIECRPPEKGKRKEVDEQGLCRWLGSWARERHDVVLAPGAAEQMLDVVGLELGLLDQELAKLALFVGRGGQVTPQLVLEVAGGWRTKTTWDLLDAAVNGDAADALRQLDRLLQAGEPPQAMFGAVSWSLRRFAAATRIIQEQERRGGRPDLRGALTAAGFRNWPAGALDKAQRQLVQLTRRRAGMMYRWLLQTDLALKGTHSAPDRARLALEKLICRMARDA